MKPEGRKQRWSLNILFSGIFLVFFVIIGVISTAVIVLLIHLDVLAVGHSALQADLIVGAIVLASVVFGTLLTGVLSRIPLRPINRIINAMNALAAGNFQTRLSFAGRLGAHPAVRELTESFNTMASELGSTELLRADFINNFSHEFKTPIVSIAGFAKLLKRVDLPEDERREYLDIIESESLRLSELATNVLNMTKVESQTILTDVSRFNLSEQLRNCVLLLEPKWSKKDIEWDIELDEHTVFGSRELLQEVWVNLLDNAIKFTPEKGTVTIHTKEEKDHVSLRVKDTGVGILPQDAPHIFDRFYKADKAHTVGKGTGLGLAICYRIMERHGQHIRLVSGDGGAEFEITLEKGKNAGGQHGDSGKSED